MTQLEFDFPRKRKEAVLSLSGGMDSSTVLLHLLANDYNARLVLEEFEKNPFLSKFYKDPERHAFALELFFMAERYHQLKEQKEQDLFKPLFEKISNAINAVAERENFTHIFSAGVPGVEVLLYAKPTDDVSSLVLAELGIDTPAND